MAFPGAIDGQIHGALVYLSAPVVVTTAVHKIIDWDLEVYDTDGCHSVTADKNRMVVPVGFRWAKVTVSIDFESGAPPSLRMIHVKKNGGDSTPDFEVADVSTGTSDALVIHAETPWLSVIAGDWFEVHAHQTSGSDKNINTKTPSVTWCHLEIA